MAYQSIWYYTGLPKDIVNILDDYVSEKFDSEMRDSELIGRHKDKNKRNSENAWINTNHWIAGFLWHYVNKANRENFLYDLTNIDGENLQYTKYSEGQFYNWHNDAGINNYYKPGLYSNNVDRTRSFSTLDVPESTGGTYQIKKLPENLR